MLVPSNRRETTEVSQERDYYCGISEDPTHVGMEYVRYIVWGQTYYVVPGIVLNVGQGQRLPCYSLGFTWYNVFKVRRR